MKWAKLLAWVAAVVVVVGLAGAIARNARADEQPKVTKGPIFITSEDGREWVAVLPSQWAAMEMQTAALLRALQEAQSKKCVPTT